MTSRGLGRFILLDFIEDGPNVGSEFPESAGEFGPLPWADGATCALRDRNGLVELVHGCFNDPLSNSLHDYKLHCIIIDAQGRPAWTNAVWLDHMS